MKIKDAPIYPIVDTISNYISTAVAIANNKNLDELKKYYSEKAKESLFENKFVISDLEKIFIKLVS